MEVKPSVILALDGTLDLLALVALYSASVGKDTLFPHTQRLSRGFARECL